MRYIAPFVIYERGLRQLCITSDVLTLRETQQRQRAWLPLLFLFVPCGVSAHGVQAEHIAFGILTQSDKAELPD